MEACVPNIGPRQRQRRLATGIISLALALGACAWIVTLHQPSLLVRAAVFLPFYGAFLGLLQYRERT